MVTYCLICIFRHSIIDLLDYLMIYCINRNTDVCKLLSKGLIWAVSLRQFEFQLGTHYWYLFLWSFDTFLSILYFRKYQYFFCRYLSSLLIPEYRYGSFITYLVCLRWLCVWNQQVFENLKSFKKFSQNF